MTRELYVSSTPHETRVGMVEDDQLAEIYLERENEYTLAGSIYKGRVTRVLPGMQSAFVDIGLERDAFLYVSDFMELHDEDEVEEIPANGAQPYQVQQETHGTEENHVPDVAEQAPTHDNIRAVGNENAPAPENRPRSGEGEQRDSRGNWRSRRRGRGRRGERMPESRFARAESPQPTRPDYGPPPGYQPMVLPGESISKYQRLAQTQSAQRTLSGNSEAAGSVSAIFPDDEPLFTSGRSESQQAGIEERNAAPATTPSAEHESKPEHAKEETFRNHEQFEEPNAPRVIADSVTEHESSVASEETPITETGSGFGMVEQEVIDEEEADLASYVEELQEDAAFDEMEEETHHAADYQLASQQIVASSEPSPESAVPFSSEPTSTQEVEIVSAEEEADEEAQEEAEVEEAQAEAEALLDAEARGNGTIEARAEVRAPSGTAPYTQRAPRPSFDRQGGPRGRRGGRRFRRREPQQLPQITDLAQGRPGDPGPDRQGANREEGRADHQPHCIARPIPGLHAYGATTPGSQGRSHRRRSASG